MDDERLDDGCGEGSDDPVVRGRVNNRVYVFRESDGRVLKGPKENVGQFVAPKQLERIKADGRYHGHLFLAERVEDRRLREMEYEMADLNDPPFEVNTSVIYQGQPGWKVTQAARDGRSSVITQGQRSHFVSNRRLRESAVIDRDAPLEDPTPIEFHTPDPADVSRQIHHGEVELDEAQLSALLDDIIENKMDVLVDKLQARLLPSLMESLKSESDM